MIIQVEKASFSYAHSINIFNDLSFSISHSDILSILGPNGCGKTTLLKCLNGLFRLNRGAIRIDDKDINELEIKEIGKKIGYVPQSHAETFSYDVIDVVLMGRAPHLGLFASPTDEDAVIAEENIYSLGLSHLINRPFTELSSGEAQMVLIARALTAEPKILLLDEPASHLDFRNQMIILDTLEKLAAERGITIVMTTHFPNHALSISNKGLILSNKNGARFGYVEEIMTEQYLQEIFNVTVKIVSISENGRNGRIVVPIKINYP